MNQYSTKEERRKFQLRTIIISSLLVLNVLGIYLYYYVLVFNAIAPGKVYGESTFNGGRYEIYTLKYYYQYNGITYFDKIDYVMGQDLELGDSIHFRVFRPYPAKHIVDKVLRDESKAHRYDCEDGFIIRYNEEVNQHSDYLPKDTKTHTTARNKRLILSSETPQDIKIKVSQAIDNIRFNQGSLIDYYMLKATGHSLYIYSIYHYMNDFSTDAMPAKILYQELKQLMPDKDIYVSTLELDNAKKEYMLDTQW
ncbi:hypothetical protein J1N10_16830 [Carboxylicivirga sp. A043]|uniref:hypothetical protein n=1 Tax=Carboxylicivirga litoralis TaxID=2816963 RepID=UPI0021CB2D0C|nr:hypothetical protein [Carboxylicivirga sp. A043]MCU4157644.1 hypothetical protein [Carboxylicivirga sp. A043]